MTTVTELKGNVKLSSDPGATTSIGGNGIKFDTLTTDNTTGTQGLYTNKTAGTLNIATTQTSGNINVGGVGSTTTIKGNFTVDNPITIGYPINNTTFATIGSYQLSDFNGGATTYNLTSSLSFSQLSIALPTGIYQCTAKLNIKTPTATPFFNTYFYLSSTVLANGAVQTAGISAQSWGGQAEGYYVNLANQEVQLNFSAPVVVSSTTANLLSIVCYSDQTVCNVRTICSAIRIG